jgi:hypothetical protein
MKHSTLVLVSWLFTVTPAYTGPILPTPAGLPPGSQFRFAFITDGGTTSQSANIADYNAFVNADARGVTYNGSLVTWHALVSTSAVNVLSNVGEFGVPVYLAGGTLVAPTDNAAGLWSGGILNAIIEDAAGNTTGWAHGNPFPSQFVWTGSTPTGATGNALGTVDDTAGLAGHTDGNWVGYINSPFGNGIPDPLYALSDVLTVPAAAPTPEPASLTLFGLGSLGLLGYGRRRRKA